ncbi:MAG: amino acid permease [Elusimicrobiales bacterium]|nr:APC family permease [Elusimicrobiales bacterium]HPO96033.1 APC family permease [Elusimicrobiales bacterium]
MNKKIKNVFILSTAVLSFISFWRAGAIVLCDFGSSAYYAGGIAAKAYGPAFPYFILAVMILAGLLLMAYIESSSLFTRGGVYVVVRETMGKPMAKLSVSALVFDYLLTAPISAVSAGLYLAYLLEIILPYFKINWHINPRFVAVIFSLAVIFYFWKENIKGVKESSQNNIRIIWFVSFVGILLLILSFYTIQKKGFVWPEFKFSFSDESLGWAKYVDFLKPVGIIGIIMAMGHSILALSGLETLAQVYREIEDPKIKNLKKAVILIFIFGLIFTGVLTFLSSVIIPYDKIISDYSENLLSGLAMELSVPYYLKISMKTLVVVSALLMLVGAVNTAIVGANGILNRVAEDGILPDSVRKLHPKYGTTYKVITIVAILQSVIVVLSKGDVFLLGEAYAFGVLWSLSFNLLAIIFLRFKDYEHKREWKYPFNIKIRKYDVPIGLILVFLIIFSLSVINLFTKNIATILGISFSIILYLVFTYSEKKQSEDEDIHKIEEDVDEEKVNISTEKEISDMFKRFTKPEKILVPVRNPNNLSHLKSVLEKANDDQTDIVVLYVKVEKGYEYALNYDNLTNEEKELFREIILIAEKYGKTVHPVIIFSNDPVYIILYSAIAGRFNKIVMGVSPSVGAEAQLENIALEWGMIRPDNFNSKIDISIIWESRELSYKLE